MPLDQLLTAAPPAADPRRPLFHYSVPVGWMNDPNGMLYHAGEYHLFYQHYPDDIVWGPMHWGHAVSSDLRRWRDLPIALAPDAQGAIFSGSAVVDHHGTAGFGAGAMVAIFTQERPGRQAQSLAYSHDRGRSWTMYAANPVLPPPAGVHDFRDPRVFWHDDGAGAGHWVMLLAAGQAIWIYTSPDLKRWAQTDTVGGRGAAGGVWECPDLLELPVDGGPATRWALIVSVAQGAPAGGSGQQYFVGDFDGARFTPDEPPDVVRWADYGADFYAAQSWNAAPAGRRLWLAWMSNWEYARQTPASTWRGMMSAPRELALVRDADGTRLAQRPAAELEALRRPLGAWADLALAPGANPIADLQAETIELAARFAVDDTTTAARFGLRVRVGAGEQTSVGYDRARGALYFDRSRSGQAPPGFETPQVVIMAPREGAVELRILVDRSSVEVFADGGRVCLTNQIFPGPASRGVEAFAEGGEVRLMGLEVWRLEVANVKRKA